MWITDCGLEFSIHSKLLNLFLQPWRWRRCSYETSVKTQRTTRRHILQTLQKLSRFCSAVGLKGPIDDQSCCATLRVVQHDWPCMVLIDLIVNGQTCVAQHDWSCVGRIRLTCTQKATLYCMHLINISKLFSSPAYPHDRPHIIQEFYLLGYNAVQSVESQPTFRRNISPHFPGSKIKSREKPNLPASCGFLLGLFFDLENGGDVLLHKVYYISAIYPIR
jgi:hypothetical protein